MKHLGISVNPPHRFPAPEQGKAIQLLVVADDGTVSLNQEAIELIGSVPDPLRVLSVVGGSRQGKSTLLNIIAQKKGAPDLHDFLSLLVLRVLIFLLQCSQKGAHMRRSLEACGLGSNPIVACSSLTQRVSITLAPMLRWIARRPHSRSVFLLVWSSTFSELLLGSLSSRSTLPVPRCPLTTNIPLLSSWQCAILLCVRPRDLPLNIASF